MEYEQDYNFGQEREAVENYEEANGFGFERVVYVTVALLSLVSAVVVYITFV